MPFYRGVNLLNMRCDCNEIHGSWHLKVANGESLRHCWMSLHVTCMCVRDHSMTSAVNVVILMKWTVFIWMSYAFLYWRKLSACNLSDVCHMSVHDLLRHSAPLLACRLFQASLGWLPSPDSIVEGHHTHLKAVLRPGTALSHTARSWQWMSEADVPSFHAVQRCLR
jgi:hypothetical protein